MGVVVVGGGYRCWGAEGCEKTCLKDIRKWLKGKIRAEVVRIERRGKIKRSQCPQKAAEDAASPRLRRILYGSHVVMGTWRKCSGRRRRSCGLEAHYQFYTEAATCVTHGVRE